MSDTALRLGSDFTLSIGTESENLEEVDLARDVSFDPSWREITAAYRGAGKWYRKRPGFAEWGATFDMIYDAGNAAFAVLQDAFQDRTPLYVESEGPTGEKLEGVAYVQSFTQGEPVEELATKSVTLMGDGELEYTGPTT